MVRIWARHAPLRCGNVVVLAISMTTLVLMLALTIDVGYWYHQKGKLQMVTDLAVMSSLGSSNVDLSVDGQKAYLKATVDKVAVANGYQVDQFRCAYGVKSSIVTTLTIDACQSVETFFWKVVGIQGVTVCVRSKAEDIRPDDANPTICCSSFSLGSTEVKGQGGNSASIDSYDSRVGSFNATHACTGTGKLFDKGRAGLCTNGTLKITGGTALFGSAYAGSTITLDGSNLAVLRDLWAGSTIDGQGTTKVLGQMRPNEELQTYSFALPTPPANIATPVTGNANRTISFSNKCNTQGTNLDAGILSLSGNNCVCYVPSGGQYYFTDIQATAQVQILLTGTPTPGSPTTWWLDGNLSASGSVNFQSAAARSTDLRINAYKPGSQIKLSMSGEAFLDVYAPQTDLDLTSSGILYGRIISNNLKISGGGTFIFDEALGCVFNAALPSQTNRTGNTHLIE